METLITKYFNGSITPEEKERLFSTMEESSSIQKEFLLMKEVSCILSSAPQEGDDEMALSALKQFHTVRATKERPFTFRKIIWYASAAAIIIAAGVFGIFLYDGIGVSGIGEMTANANNDDNAIVVSLGIAFEEVCTGNGEVHTITLDDNTKVWLNANTTLRYPKTFNKSERHVELVEGEAFFDVTHNKDLPFIVTSKGYDIRVLGTKFNVLAYPGTDFKTSLVEGSIEVAPVEKKEKAIRIVPNQIAQVVNGKLISDKLENTDELLWKDGILVFKNIPFSEIATKFESYYGIKISVDNEDITYRKFSGKFRRDDGPEVALNAMQKAYDFNYEYNPKENKYTITK